MNQHKSNLATIFQQINLIGNTQHREYLNILTEFGLKQSGGSFPDVHPPELKRLVFDINLLDSAEKKQIVYSETILKN